VDITSFIPDDENRLKMVKALTDPIRLRLFYFFSEPHTVREASEALGVKPNGLYHHLNILKKTGLVEVVEKKKVRNMTQNIYQVTEHIDLDRHKMRDPGPKAPFFEIIKNIAWTTYEDCSRELTTAEGKKAYAARFFVKIRKDDLTHLPKKIAQASREFEEKIKSMGDESGDIRYSVTILEFEMSD